MPIAGKSHKLNGSVVKLVIKMAAFSSSLKRLYAAIKKFWMVLVKFCRVSDDQVIYGYSKEGQSKFYKI